MSKKGVVALGVQLDYKKTLDDMTRSFKTELDRIQEEFKEINIPDKIKNQITELSGKIDKVTDETKIKIEELTSGKLETKEFEAFQKEVSGHMQNIRRDITVLKNDLTDLQKKFKLTGGGAIATEIITEFKGVQDTLKNTTKLVLDFYKVCSKNGIEINFDGIDNSAKDINRLQESLIGLDKALKYIQYANKSNISFSSMDVDEINQKLTELTTLRNQIKDAFDKLSKADSQSDFGKSLKLQVDAINAARHILHQTLSQKTGEKNPLSMSDKTLAAWEKSYQNRNQIATQIVEVANKTKQAIKEANNDMASVASFQVKDGKIHIPIEIATREATLQKTLTDLIDELNQKATKKPVVIPIALVSNYKTKTLEEARQQLGNDDIGLLEINVEKALENSLKTTLRGALNTASAVLVEIQKIFEKNPVNFPLHIDKEAFVKELADTIDTGLKSIKDGEANHILDMTKTLEHLKKCLVELNQLSGNDITVKGLENFDGKSLGLSEESLGRIVNAIRDIEDVLRRVYNLPTASDMLDQWTKIEAKFKSFASPTGKINLSKDKKHIKELIELYSEYIKLGGTNPFAELTDNAETIKKLATQLEKYNVELSKTQQQEKKVVQQDQKTPTKKDLGYKDDSSAIDNKNESIEKLQGKIKDLEIAITSKTDAIKQEQWQMEASAVEEVIAIDNIIDKIVELKNHISSIQDIKVPEIRIAATQAAEQQVHVRAYAARVGRSRCTCKKCRSACARKTCLYRS